MTDTTAEADTPAAPKHQSWCTLGRLSLSKCTCGASRAEPLDIARNELAETIWEAGIKQTMSQSEQAANSILAELRILRARTEDTPA